MFILCGAALIALTIPLLASANTDSGQAQSHLPFDLPIQASMEEEYNFEDDPNPQLLTFINAANEIDLVDGSPQSELITTAFTGSSVTITIVPPSGWTLDSVEWDSGNGTYAVPPTGTSISHDFEYTASQGTESKSGNGTFTIKKNGS